MAERHRRPLIGITGPSRGSLGPRLCIHLGILLAGGRGLQLRPGDEPCFPKLDGLVISGGHDVEPVLYKAEAEVEGRYDPVRDRFESEMIDRAVSRVLPVLGICRGAQLLNVRLGGSLLQDLTRRRKATSRRRTVLPLKNLGVSEGSVLARVTGACRMKINSLHDQAIDRLGRGLRVSGADQDGIVQAVEDPAAPFRIGVQWHPEFLLYLRAHRRLFSALVRSASHPGRRKRAAEAERGFTRPAGSGMLCAGPGSGAPG